MFVGIVFKILPQNFLSGEGKLYKTGRIMWKWIGVVMWNFLGELTQTVTKDLQNRKTVPQTFYNGGRHVQSHLRISL